MFKKLLAAEFEPHGVLSEDQLAKLEAHYLSLTRWNERLNLTRIVGLSESVKFHYCESLFLARHLPPGPLSVVDIGSGAGFPGIPLAIFRPECQVSLVEAHQRKSVFLREASRDLKNVKVLPKRAELVTEKFDWLVSRAVSPSDVLGLNLTDSIALLISQEDASNLDGDSKPIPWGNQRVLFHVKRKSQSDD